MHRGLWTRLSTPGSWTPARGSGLTGVSGVLDEFGTHPGLLDLLPTAVRPHSSRQTHHWTPYIDPGTHHILDSSCRRTCLGFQRNHGLLAEPSWIPGCVLEFETQLGGYTPYRELLDQSLTPGSWTWTDLWASRNSCMCLVVETHLGYTLDSCRELSLTPGSWTPGRRLWASESRFRYIDDVTRPPVKSPPRIFTAQRNFTAVAAGFRLNTYGRQAFLVAGTRARRSEL